MSSLAKRVITALVLLVALVCALALTTPLTFFYLAAFLLVLAAWEWGHFIGAKNVFKRYAMVFFSLCLFLGLHFLSPDQGVSISIVASVFALLWLFVATIGYQVGSFVFGVDQPAICFLIGVILLPGFFQVIVALHQLSGAGLSAPYWLVYSFVLVFITDSSAYFLGSWLGKTPLIPRVSPNKTVAGFVGSAITVLLCAVLVSMLLHLSTQQRYRLLLVSLLSFMAAVMGDLMISCLKRIANVKDTGSIFPGHGGLLDRLDSLIGSCLVFYVVAIGLHLLPGRLV
jgi:phosphatidate cytidylyltransferase